MNRFFSIVVPCCEVAPYLDALAASLEGQSFADWECVLSVEDSKDGTLAACEALAKGDPRFRVVSGPRSGSPATPRNRGFEIAGGRYVIWLDGDDFLEDGALAALADALRAHGEPEVLFGALEEAAFADDGRTRVRSARKFGFAADDSGRVFTGQEAFVRLMRHGSLPFIGAQVFVCRSDFLRAQGISFVPGLRHEDEEWSPRVFYFAKSLLVLDQVIFVYRQREGSIMSTQAGAKALEHHVRVDRAFFDFHAAHAFTDALSRAWAREGLSLFYFHFFYPSRRRLVPGRDWRRCLGEVLQGDGLKNFLRLAKFGSAPKRVGAWLVALARIHPALGELACLYFRFVYYPLAMKG
jgi:glycosyltransferase involved in cell wall biosynthesis